MTDSLELEAYSALVGDIYDCAIDPARWPATLAKLCAELGFVNAVLAIQPLPDGPSQLSATTGIAPAFLAALPQFGNDALAQWGGAAAARARPVGEPLVLSRINPAACDPAREDRYYREWRAPQGLVDTLNITLLREPALIGVASFGRHRDHGLIGDREVRRARLLVPHLQRAATISHILDVRTIAASTARAVLDALAIPTLIVGPDLEILHANPAAEELLARSAPIRRAGGRLAAMPARVETQLRLAVGHAVANESGIGTAGLGVGAVTADGSSQLLHVLPLRQGALRPGMIPGAAAAIFVRAAVADEDMPVDHLARLFDLTSSEARVFELIAQGRSVGEVAAALGVRQSTVKTHLLRLFDKLGVRRQAELVALAARFRLPLRRPDAPQLR